MMDQAEVLRSRALPTAMVLPASAAFSEGGVESGLRRFADRLGKPFILYLRAEAYLSPAGIERLVKDKLVKAIKYGITREEPRRDDYLSELIQRVGAEMIISGMGERPAIVHLAEFGLPSFTSGAVCIAPAPLGRRCCRRCGAAISRPPSGCAPPSCLWRIAAMPITRCASCMTR